MWRNGLSTEILIAAIVNIKSSEQSIIIPNYCQIMLGRATKFGSLVVIAQRIIKLLTITFRCVTNPFVLQPVTLVTSA